MGLPPAKPSRIGAYDIVEVIGRGGMGTVYKGTDPRIGRSVAVKVLTAAADDPDLLLRFYREAKYTGSLQHQNIVTVYELGHQDGLPYLVMEYLEGVSLDAVIASGRPMPIAEKLKIILQICSGLSYAHKRDLVHRDIKPANIVILDNSTAKIVDFGIARLEGNRLTKTGHVVGSLNYMSPEQLNGTMDVDLRTDVYSTGVVLYQLLTGALPFDGGSTAATLMKIVQEPPPPLEKYLKDCPPELEAITQKALAKNREDRYASADDFAFDVGRLQQQYEQQLLADYLRQAQESLQRRDFTAARQQVLQVLRAAPQNTEGGDLLRLIKKGLDQQQRAAQAQQCQLNAEAAFRKNDLTAARQFVDEGLRVDPASAELLSLSEAIVAAQARVAKCMEILRRAEAALRSGNLEAAKRFIEEASEILPDDPACRSLAAQIAARIDQRLREQETSRQRKLRDEESALQHTLREDEAEQRRRQFAPAISELEKVMAEARMLLFLGQAHEALRSLIRVENDVAQLPPRWKEPFDTLKQEAQTKLDEVHRGITSEWVPVAEQHTAEISDPFGATSVLRPDSAPSEADLQLGETNRGAGAVGERSVSYEDNSEIAPELREFLEPTRSVWSRPVVWVAIVLVVVSLAVVAFLFLPKQAAVTGTKPISASGGTVIPPIYSYAEINAEPWGIVKEITPASGDSQAVVGSTTPLRVKLPAGQYAITLEGPNHEQKRTDCTVPSQGGTSCQVTFRKPDFKKILSEQ